jgi:hypothetical protein
MASGKKAYCPHGKWQKSLLSSWQVAKKLIVLMASGKKAYCPHGSVYIDKKEKDGKISQNLERQRKASFYFASKLWKLRRIF